MKNIKLSILLILLSLAFATNAQTSQRGFSFQGYAISNDGIALGEQSINI